MGIASWGELLLPGLRALNHFASYAVKGTGGSPTLDAWRVARSANMLRCGRGGALQVTPGGERTMRTCLGAADELREAALLPPGWARGCAWLHCEGYVLHRPAVALAVIGEAAAGGAKVCVPLLRPTLRVRVSPRSDWTWE